MPFLNYFSPPEYARPTTNSVCFDLGHSFTGARQMRNIITLLLFLVVTSSHAAVYYKETGWKLEPDGNGVYSVLPEQGRGGATTSGCTTISCSRSGGLGGPLGKPRPTMTPSTTFPKGNIAASALALGSRALPWLSIGYGLYDWYNSAGLTLDENGLNAAEPYNPAVLGSGTWTFEEAPSKTLGYGSPDSACTAYNSWRSNVGLIPLSGIYARQTGGGYVCTGAFPDGVISWTAAIVEFLPSNRCPFGSANSAGQCPYTPTSSPVSESDARQRLIDAPITSDILRRSFDEILDAGGGVASTGTTVSGPSSAPGETTTRTSTAANGTTQVSTTTTNYNYTYNDNRVTVTETKTTQNPDGSTETETTDQPKDECARNPEALKCKELGQETGSPTWETKTVLFQAENLGLSGACPAPWVANLRGWNLTMSYQPVCDVAPTVRLGLLAVTALMCIFVVIRVTQS